MQRAEFWDRFKRQQLEQPVSPFVAKMLYVLDELRDQARTYTALKRSTRGFREYPEVLQALEEAGLVTVWEIPQSKNPYGRAVGHTPEGRQVAEMWRRIRALLNGQG